MAQASQEKILIGAALALACALAWVLTVYHAQGMAGMEGMDMGGMEMAPEPPSVARFAGLFAMWLAMMCAMMLPAIYPMLTAFAAVNRVRHQREEPYVATAFFVLGYLIAWALYSALAVAAQWGLESAGLLDSMMESTSRTLGGMLFLLAGLYQWTPLKEVCLARCRSPVGFVLTEWRDGTPGAIVMGLRHGAFCVGCCGALMLLLFALAVMNLLWVAALTVLVMAEKLLPGGTWLRHAIGAGLTLAGLVLLGGTLL